MGNFFEEIGKKDLVTNLVSTGLGAVAGYCASRTIYTAVDNLMPDEIGLGTKIIYGIGSSCIGGFVGNNVREAVEQEILGTGGTVLTFKAGLEEISKTFNQEKEA